MWMWHMHNGFIHISLGHLPLRTMEHCAGSTRQRFLQNVPLSGVHKVTVVFFGPTPAGGMLLLNHCSMIKQVKGMTLSDGMMLCRCVRTVALSMVVGECTLYSGDCDLWCCSLFGLDVSQSHNHWQLFVYFSELSHGTRGSLKSWAFLGVKLRS